MATFLVGAFIGVFFFSLFISCYLPYSETRESESVDSSDAKILSVKFNRLFVPFSYLFCLCILPSLCCRVFV